MPPCGPATQKPAEAGFFTWLAAQQKSGLC
jgi:hypothetical protein